MSLRPEAGNSSTGGVRSKHYRQGRRIAARYEIAKKKKRKEPTGESQKQGLRIEVRAGA